MIISEYRIAYLLEVYSNGKSSKEEEQELYNWVSIGDEVPIKKHIEELVTSHNSNGDDSLVDWERLYKKIIDERNNQNKQPVIQRIMWYRWAAAAAVVILMGTGYFFFTASSSDQKVLSEVEQPKMNDIPPPNTANAILTLNNGQKIILDSANTGRLAMQGSVIIMKLADGQIAYHGNNKNIQYNTLTNPRGSKVVNMTLADGTKIWLNSLSSIRFPTTFVGNERKVEITGEVYFEVAHNVKMPFFVKAGDMNVEVLGTHFNVNTYVDEEMIKTTLLEGSVKVSAKNSSIVIAPGEQTNFSNTTGKIELKKNVYIEEVTAWKNGKFVFQNADLDEIIRQLEKWYDVSFENHNKNSKEEFVGIISRDVNISQILHMLEKTEMVKFEIKGKKIIVK